MRLRSIERDSRSMRSGSSAATISRVPCPQSTASQTRVSGRSAPQIGWPALRRTFSMACPSKETHSDSSAPGLNWVTKLLGSGNSSVTSSSSLASSEPDTRCNTCRRAAL